MAQLSAGLYFPLGGNPLHTTATVSDDQARSILVALLPPGHPYDTDNPNADMYSFFHGLGQTLKKFGFDLVDIARVEFNPAAAVQKLPDWEGVLGIVNTSPVQPWLLDTPTRQAAIVGKLRESGAVTFDNIRAAIAPLLGYTNPNQLVVYECSRSALTALHTYSTSPVSSIPANSSVSSSITINGGSDGGTVSAAGAQVGITITFGDVSQLTVQLTSPSGTAVSWTLGTGSATSTLYNLYSETFAGVSVDGTWTLKITNASGSTGTLVSWSNFVEGVGQNLATGGAIFEWGVYADPALVGSSSTANYPAALQALGRIQPSFSKAYLLRSIFPYPDTTSGANMAIPDACIPS